MCKIAFKLDLPPALVVSLNAIYSGSHWRQRQRIKRDYMNYTHKIFKELVREYGQMKKPCKISFEFSGTRIKDCDNHVYMGKMITDCLVNAGLFVDDSAKYISAVTYTKSEIKAKSVSVNVAIREA